MKTLKQLIKENNFYYVNSYITEDNFPIPENIEEVEYDIVDFNRYIVSEDAIKELSKDGYRPATLYDLLAWKNWNNSDFVVALGSVAEVDGSRRVPCLNEDFSGRRLGLDWFDGDWNDDCRFLRVRNLDSKSLSTGHSDTLSLKDKINDAITLLKSEGFTITKEY